MYCTTDGSDNVILLHERGRSILSVSIIEPPLLEPLAEFSFYDAGREHEPGEKVIRTKDAACMVHNIFTSPDSIGVWIEHLTELKYKFEEAIDRHETKLAEESNLQYNSPQNTC